MAKELQGQTVAILASDGVERIELDQPRGAPLGAGARSELLSTHSGRSHARQGDSLPAGTVTVDRARLGGIRRRLRRPGQHELRPPRPAAPAHELEATVCVPEPHTNPFNPSGSRGRAEKSTEWQRRAA